MTALRWFAFLLVGIVTIAIAQLLTGMLAKAAPWWISVPLVLFFGVVLTIATIVPVTMAPNPKIGATILLTLLLLFEIIVLVSQFPEMTVDERIVRILTDIYLCSGALRATTSGSEKTALALWIDKAQAEHLDGVAFVLMQEHAQHLDSAQTVDGILAACNSRNELRYLMKAIDRVLRSHYNAPYQARAVLTTSWQQQCMMRLS
jgi:hypothetical protein